MGCGGAEGFPELKYRESMRQDYEITEAITYNSTTGLFQARNKNLASSFAYFRFTVYKKDNAKILMKRLGGLSQYRDLFKHYIPYSEIGRSPSYFYLATDCNKDDELFVNAILNKSIVLTERSLILSMKGLLETLKEMHEKKICHGQINPSKIILRNHECYLFDISTGIEETGDLLSENCGFLAPEILNAEDPSFPSDVWGLGATLYYILTGHQLFAAASTTEYVKIALEAEPSYDDPVWSSVTPGFKAIISSMLTKEKSKRITMKEILSSSWLIRTLNSAQGEIAKANPIIDNTLILSRDINSRKILMKCLTVLANSKRKSEFSQLRKELGEMDADGSKRLDLCEIMKKSLGSGDEIIPVVEKYAPFPVMYELMLSDALSLHTLMIQERAATQFYSLSKGSLLIDFANIQQVCSLYESSFVMGDLEKFKGFIKNNQNPQRDGYSLNLKEFINLLDNIGIQLTDQALIDHAM